MAKKRTTIRSKAAPAAALAISEAEWAIMDLLWDAHPQTSPELCETLERSRQWKRATVMTLLNRLIAKGAISADSRERKWLYHPAVTRQECVAEETRGFLERVFKGALLPMVAHCIQHQGLSEKELAGLRAMLAPKAAKPSRKK